MKKKILFVGHSAGHTGAPIILLRFIQWFKNNTDIDFEVLLKNDGKLRSSYEAVSPVFLYNPAPSKSTAPSRLLKKIIRRLSNKKKQTKNQLRKKYPPSSINLIFCNTITNGEILSSLSYLKCPVICRVAELDFWINKSGKENFDLVKKHVTYFIAVSEAVKQNLVLNYDIPQDKIEIIHGFITSPHIATSPDIIRNSLLIPQNNIVIGGSGAEIWRKGKDLFIQLAITVFKKSKDLPIHFVWVGGNKDGAEVYQLQHDIRQAGLSDQIHLVPEVSNPIDYFATFDIFAMVSREDPYPIVNLEVASLGKPILCFEKAGGSPEFVQYDAGFVVPYLDINDMAEKVILLSKDKVLRKKLGTGAAQKVRERHDISVAAPKILNLISHYLN